MVDCSKPLLNAAAMAKVTRSSSAAVRKQLQRIRKTLGQFGYFAHPLLSKESETGTSGNYGLMDQLHALKWFQKNIAQFGGDANNVTIFGESAGGVNCTALMLSPLARGLFHRVTAQSGAVLMKRRFLKENAGEMPSGHKGGEQLAKDLLGNADVSLAALREVSAEAIVDSSRKTGALPGLPTDVRNIGVLIDGYVIPDDPYQMLAKGQFNRVPLMIGVNTDEGTVFTQRVRFFRSAGYRAMLGKFFPNNVERVAKLYPGQSGREATQAFKKLLSDSMIVHPARKFADEVSKHDVPVYFYVFSRAPTFAIRSGLGLEFAKTGTPKIEGLPDWPLYDDVKAACLELNETIGVTQRYRQPYYKLLDELTMQRVEDE